MLPIVEGGTADGRCMVKKFQCRPALVIPLLLNKIPIDEHSCDRVKTFKAGFLRKLAPKKVSEHSLRANKWYQERISILLLPFFII